MTITPCSGTRVSVHNIPRRSATNRVRNEIFSVAHNFRPKRSRFTIATQLLGSSSCVVHSSFIIGTIIIVHHQESWSIIVFTIVFTVVFIIVHRHQASSSSFAQRPTLLLGSLRVALVFVGFLRAPSSSNTATWRSLSSV